MINYLKNNNKEQKKNLIKKIGYFLLTFLIISFGFIFFKVGHTFSLVSDGNFWTINKQEDNYNEKNRIDILILGIRGAKDELYGGTLADSIMLLSLKTDTKKAALISIPRDLYVKIPRHNNLKEKINYAYAFGENKNIGGINIMKEVVQNVTGVNIDYAVVVDFSTFKDLIDSVGGIDIYLKKEFVEKSQWGWEFRVPAGENHMNGDTALYYARSRFSTNDFDRARRQQEIIVALKDKLTTMGVLTNPIKLNKIFNSIGKGVKTNINFTTALKLIKYTDYLSNDKLIKKVLDTSKTGPLQAGTIDGKYVLYPKAGLGNFTDIKKEIRNIFE